MGYMRNANPILCPFSIITFYFLTTKAKIVLKAFYLFGNQKIIIIYISSLVVLKYHYSYWAIIFSLNKIK